ncbi:hypothetical protein [uncultured Helicobacter sp.]|uniref:hypothetical protein n=1 Tax=uncultured Helicobacter sp. TaxID=175537 RepID=UPI002627BF59|nr:hypothetical protein [uncultured Helicobacter sp.]
MGRGVLRLRKIPKANRFSIEIYALAQNYKLTQSQQKQHKELLKYLLTKKSFNFTQADVCLDTTQLLKTQKAHKTKQYKGTNYLDFGEAGQLCIYNKAIKDRQRNMKCPAQYGILRYEATLKLSKNHTTLNRPKATQQGKCKPSSPHNKKISKNLKRDSQYLKYSTKEFFKYLSINKKQKVSMRHFTKHILAKGASP